MKTNFALMILAAGMLTVLSGCRYADAENQIDEYEPTIKISPIHVGKIDWSNPHLVLCLVL